MNRVSARNLAGLARVWVRRMVQPAFRAEGISFVGRRVDIDVRSPGSFALGAGSYISDGCTVVCRGRVQIGRRVFCNKSVFVAAYQEVTIGDGTLIGPMVTIIDNEHEVADRAVPVRSQGFVSAPIHIGANVVIGAKATILKGVTIGDNCVVGAHSVVKRSVPANTVVAGAPARIVRLLR